MIFFIFRLSTNIIYVDNIKRGDDYEKTNWSALSITTASVFVAMTAIGANITSIAPFMVVGGVPITLQTFFAVLAGIVLGSRLGAFSMFVYMMLGLVGAPIF